MNIAFITTFPNDMYEVYAKKMLQSFVQFMPAYPLMVQLDDDLLYPDVDKTLRPQDGIAVGWEEAHAAFVARNKDKDHPTDYRKQATRFCHKVFAIHRVYEAARMARESGDKNAPRYLIWLDADVIINRKVTEEDIKKCLPKEGDAVAYLGRKDWDHSECGWLAFDLDNGGTLVIERTYNYYINDLVLSEKQCHDSWIWDRVLTGFPDITNLTEGKPGTEIWQQSPMAEWSTHYKGPRAKQELFQQPKIPQGQNFVIQTKNAIPHEEICRHIEENQKLIKNWIKECDPNDEEIVIVSAGPSFIAEDLEPHLGKKIIAVKHALKPLKEAGVKIWASILLDPRPHVADFIQDADPDVIWFVASQVNPEVTKKLLERGCEVWGYHAAVGAGEGYLTKEQPYAVVTGGSATATRGLYMLAHLGFRNFHLYGYDLSFPDKMDLNAKDEFGQPKYVEFSVGIKNEFFDVKKNFFSEPQLLAQFEEMKAILEARRFNITAYGEGIIPFVGKILTATHLRQEKIKCIMGGKLASYKDLWNNTKKTNSLTRLPKMLSKTLRRRKAKSK